MIEIDEFNAMLHSHPHKMKGIGEKKKAQADSRKDRIGNDPVTTAQNDNALANRKGQAAILLKTRKIRNNRPDQANIAAATVAAENQPQKKTTNFNISLTI